MCFPGLLAAAGPLAGAIGGAGPVAGTAAAVGGGLSTLQIVGLGATALGAASSVAEGIAGAQAGKANAKLAKREGIIDQQRRVAEQSEITRERRLIAGRQAVGAAKSGRGFSGSVLDVVAGSEANAELDILSSVYGGVLGSQSAKFQAKQARAAGRSALIGGVLGAGSTLLTGIPRALSG